MHRMEISCLPLVSTGGGNSYIKTRPGIWGNHDTHIIFLYMGKFALLFSYNQRINVPFLKSQSETFCNGRWHYNIKYMIIFWTEYITPIFKWTGSSHTSSKSWTRVSMGKLLLVSTPRCRPAAPPAVSQSTEIINISIYLLLDNESRDFFRVYYQNNWKENPTSVGKCVSWRSAIYRIQITNSAVLIYGSGWHKVHYKKIQWIRALLTGRLV